MAFGSFCYDSPYRVVVELSVQWTVEICVPFAALMQGNDTWPRLKPWPHMAIPGTNR
jgi:hypothetical protein